MKLLYARFAALSIVCLGFQFNFVELPRWKSSGYAVAFQCTGGSHTGFTIEKPSTHIEISTRRSITSVSRRRPFHHPIFLSTRHHPKYNTDNVKKRRLVEAIKQREGSAELHVLGASFRSRS